MRRQSRRTRGFVLLAVMLALGVIAAVALLLNRDGPQGAALAASSLRAAEAAYVAEAGFHHTLWQTNASSCTGYPSETGVLFGSHTYDVSVTPADGSPVTVDVTGRLADGTTRRHRRSGVRVFTNPSAAVLQPGTEGKDTIIDAALPSGNFGAADKLKVEEFDEVSAMVAFDLASLPSGLEVLSATLSLYLESWSGSAVPGTLSIHRVTRSWVEGTGTSLNPAGDGATWDDHDGTSPWSTPGGDYDATPVDTRWVDVQVGWVDLDVTSLVAAWVAGVHPNHGFLLRAPGSLDKIKFLSSDDGAAVLRPKLTVLTSCECGRICAEPIYRDEFNAKTCNESLDWAQSNGTLDWSPSPWVEFGEAADSCSAGIRIDEDLGAQYSLRLTDDGKGIERLADLSSFPTARLSFKYRRVGVGAGEYLSVQVSANGGTDWIELDQISGPATDAGYLPASYDISAYISADAAIRLEAVNLTGGASPKVFVDDVQIDDGLVGDSAGTVLLVVPDEANRTAADVLRGILMDSWGFSVEWISESDSQAAFDAAVATSDVAYVSETVQSTNLDTKLKAAPIGVVNEEGSLNDEFGISSASTWPSGTDLTVTDDEHYITSLFGLGALTLFGWSQDGTAVSGTLAPELQTLASLSGARALEVLEEGALLQGGGVAAGRRVKLPWGESGGFDPSSLTVDGQLLMQRALEWAAGAAPPPPPGSVLFVVVDESSPTVQEALRKAQFEAWGYAVTLIDATALQGDFDAAFAVNDAVYVSEEISSSDVGTKLTDAAIGVVNEEPELTDELGISSGRTWPFGSALDITDDAHFITEPFAVGPITISSAGQSNAAVAGSLAGGLEPLAEWGTDPTLAVLETGASLYGGGGSAAGPRVALPWGGGSFDFALLTTDGLTLLRRALQWAVQGGTPPEPVTLVVTQDAYMKSDKPNETRGTENELIVKLNKRQTLVEFDISGISPGTLVGSATLRLWVTTNSLAGDALLEAFAVTEAWDEAQVSWDDRLTGVAWTTGGGTHTSPAVDVAIVPDTLEDDWVEIDITPLVQEWVDGITPNRGVVLKHEQDKDLKLASHEAGDSAQHPQLYVTFGP